MARRAGWRIGGRGRLLAVAPALLAAAACAGGDPPVAAERLSTTTTVTTTVAVTVAEPAAPVTTTTVTAPAGLKVSSVTDGDTLRLADGRAVRLAQVDAPETDECFGAEATAALAAMTAGRAVALRRPPDGPAQDRYGRTLAEVTVDGISVNETLVRDGAAEWYEEFASEDAALAGRLQIAEQDASAAGRGLWSACSIAAAAPPTTMAAVADGGGACDTAYPDVCIPPAPPDLDCGSIAHRRFRVEPPDPHRFDADHDGVGCESG